jgi:hypothetical protein
MSHEATADQARAVGQAGVQQDAGRGECTGGEHYDAAAQTQRGPVFVPRVNECDRTA